VRQREDDMHVGHVEELTLPRGEPAVTGLGLTLRTVPIAARNGVLSISCLMESTRFWGARVSSRCPTRDIRPIRRDSLTITIGGLLLYGEAAIGGRLRTGGRDDRSVLLCTQDAATVALRTQRRVHRRFRGRADA
jgi:hypothetical protein